MNRLIPYQLLQASRAVRAGVNQCERRVSPAAVPMRGAARAIRQGCARAEERRSGDGAAQGEGSAPGAGQAGGCQQASSAGEAADVMVVEIN